LPVKYYLDIGSGRHRYSMPDPYALGEVYERVYRHIHYGEECDLDKDIAGVLVLAKGYLDLTTYSLGQECCVGKLRDIWRVCRSRTIPEDERRTP
jgi:hypothetical protein